MSIEEIKFGKVVTDDGKVISEGYTLEELEELVVEINETECDIYDVTGDISVGPKIIEDLINYIKTK